MKKPTVCVFCGSSSGKNPEYVKEAANTGRLLAQNNIDLIYGGASIGVMTAVADSVLENGGDVYGVMPQDLVNREVAHPDLTRLFITNSMHERKALMANLSDAFIALPGGFGTYEELFEALTWSQLEMHNKPIYLLNTAGYYDPFLALTEHGIAEGFIGESNRNLFKTVDTSEELIRELTAAFQTRKTV